MNTSQELTPQSAETLKMRMQDLAGTMAKAAESLQKGESVELQYVADEIGNVQQLMKSLSDKLREHPLLASSEQNSNDLTSLAEACRQIEMRQQAIDKLKRLQLVKSFDENDRGAFEEMAQKVTSVIETLTNGQAEDRKRAVDWSQCAPGRITWTSQIIVIVISGRLNSSSRRLRLIPKSSILLRRKLHNE